MVKLLRFIFIFSLLFVLSTQVSDAQMFDPNNLNKGNPGQECLTPIDSNKILYVQPIDKQGDFFIDRINDGINTLNGFSSIIAPLVGAAQSIPSLLNHIVGDDGNRQCFAPGVPEQVGDKCKCVDKRTQNLSRLCLNITDKTEQNSCMSCVDASYHPTAKKGIWTAMGCMSADLPTFITDTVFKFGLQFAGVAAFGCIIFAGIQMQMSQGNSETVKKAQELLTSCITGLIFIIFSVFILQVIGVDILKLPGFGK